MSEIKNRNSSSNASRRKAMRSLVEQFLIEKNENEKIKILNVIENEISYDKSIINNSDIYNLFDAMSTILIEDSHYTTHLKIQILIYLTSFIIILDLKSKNESAFVNYLNHFLIDYIKDSNQVYNIYIKETVCICLIQIEDEYPGILISLLGRRLNDIYNHILSNTNTTTTNNFNRNTSMSTFSKASNFFEMNFQEKNFTLETDGLFCIIENEKSYISQCLLRLYSKILNNYMINIVRIVIIYYKLSRVYIKSNNESVLIMNDDNKTMTTINRKQQKEVFTQSISKSNDTLLYVLYTKSYIFDQNCFCSIDCLTCGYNQVPNQITNENAFSLCSCVCNSLHSYLYSNYLYTNSNSHQSNIEHIYEIVKSSNHEILTIFKQSISNILERIYDSSSITFLSITSNITPFLILFKSLFTINKILPKFFNYLQSTSYIITIGLIHLFNVYKKDIQKGLHFKLILRLLLSINNLRLSKSKRLILLRLTYYYFLNIESIVDLNHILIYLKYYLHPNPFDSYRVNYEKLKLIFIIYFKLKVSSINNEHIFDGIVLFDIYKYYSIFSIYSKQLFKIYHLIILLFGSVNVIRKLTEIIKNNIKIVPMLIPNLLNLLRKIKKFSVFLKKTSKNQEEFCIFKYISNELSCFLGELRSSEKLNSYYSLFIELSKEEIIDPKEIIKGISHQVSNIEVKYMSSQYIHIRIEEKILKIASVLMENHRLNLLYDYNLHVILEEIYNKSLKLSIKEHSKLLLSLFLKAEKKIILDFINKSSQQLIISNKEAFFPILNPQYALYSLENISSEIIFQPSLLERRECLINDNGFGFFLYKTMKSIEKKMVYSDFEEYEDNNKSLSFIYDKYFPCQNRLNLYFNSDSSSELQKDSLLFSIFTISDMLKLEFSDDDLKNINEQEKNKNLPINEKVIYSEVIYEGNFNTVNESNLDDNFIYNDYLNQVKANRHQIILPFNLLFIDRKQENIVTSNEIYSINLFFAQNNNISIKQPILLPILQRSSEKIEAFPYFYKINLVLYSENPVPCEIETLIMYYNQEGLAYNGRLDSIHLRFEDFFLPFKYNNMHLSNHSTESNSKYGKMIFTRLWREFDSKSTETCSDYINSIRLIDIEKNNMISKIKAKLSPFICDEKEKVIKNTDLEIEEYDFCVDDILKKVNIKEKPSDSIIIYNSQEYCLRELEILIFLPSKFHLLFKIFVSERTSIIRIRSDYFPCLEYLDEYFDDWK